MCGITIYIAGDIVTYFILVDKYVILNAIEELSRKEIWKLLNMKLK